jgi:DNA-binding SARP family transcriptional activator
MNHTTSDQPNAVMQPVMQVQTLGRFDVKKSQQSLVDAAAGSKKIWELFKFMMTHRHRSFTPESLLDSLWSSEDYSDPRSTLRRQMHRLRQVLCEQDNAADAEISILYHNGYYRWNPQRQAIIDADQFETAVKMGDSMRVDLPLKALSHYQTALNHYQGDYLPECYDQQWVFPVRNHYRRLYLKAVLSVSDLLKDQRQFSEIIKISEKAIEMDIYEEEFHLRFMDALLNVGERKQALEHYEYITGFFYQEMGIKPSPAFKNIYKLMLSSQPALESIEALQADLDKSDPFENAFFCSAEVFRSIYELERRRSERSGVKAVIGMITLDQPPASSHGHQQQRMQVFQQHILQQLRKGDTVTRWNDSQFLVLLPGLDTETMDKVLRRVIQHFEQETPEAVTNIQAHCQLILPPQPSHNLL